MVQAAAGADPANLAKDPAIAEAVALRDANKKGDKAVPDKTQVKLVAQAMKKTKVKDKLQRDLILKVVTKILADAKMGADKASQEFLDNCKIADTPPKVDWAAMAKHPAVQWCQGVRLNGAHGGLWDKGKAGANNHAVGTKVYQESYAGKWVSYDVDARSHEVSDYQFRAAGEWFAEIYAAYYQKLLPPSHVDAKWFKADVHERKK